MILRSLLFAVVIVVSSQFVSAQSVVSAQRVQTTEIRDEVQFDSAKKVNILLKKELLFLSDERVKSLRKSDKLKLPESDPYSIAVFDQQQYKLLIEAVNSEKRGGIRHTPITNIFPQHKYSVKMSDDSKSFKLVIVSPEPMYGAKSRPPMSVEVPVGSRLLLPFSSQASTKMSDSILGAFVDRITPNQMKQIEYIESYLSITPTIDAQEQK
jgi:hypothetical protein